VVDERYQPYARGQAPARGWHNPKGETIHHHRRTVLDMLQSGFRCIQPVRCRAWKTGAQIMHTNVPAAGTQPLDNTAVVAIAPGSFAQSARHGEM
jgi:hypothetical protein